MDSTLDSLLKLLSVKHKLVSEHRMPNVHWLTCADCDDKIVLYKERFG